jgi:hypothetical protein
VSSLNGEPEQGVAVEAVGQKDCSIYGEDTVTDEEGKFRLRGLLVRLCDFSGVSLLLSVVSFWDSLGQQAGGRDSGIPVLVFWPTGCVFSQHACLVLWENKAPKGGLA